MQIVADARATEAAVGPRRRHRHRHRVILAVGVVVVVVAGAVAAWNRDLIGAYLTHRVREPSQTWEVVPLPPAAQPELRAIDQDGEQFDEAVIPATIPPPPEATR